MWKDEAVESSAIGESCASVRGDSDAYNVDDGESGGECGVLGAPPLTDETRGDWGGVPTPLGRLRPCDVAVGKSALQRLTMCIAASHIVD